MLDFCTYFDQNYLVRALTLYRSLARQAVPFRLWALCLDKRTFEALTALGIPEIRPCKLSELESADGQLLEAKQDRTLVEYYFTCTPALPLYLLNEHPEIELITYLDADLYFFSDPSPIFEEMGDNAILIVGHRFPARLKNLERFGAYNVGFLSFRRDDEALRCLQWWRERCLEWCQDCVQDGRFADQAYLDRFPADFKRVWVLQNKGAGLGPWNIAGQPLHTTNGRVLVGAAPVIFFHFHDLTRLSAHLYDTAIIKYGSRTSCATRKVLYGPYIEELLRTSRWLASASDDEWESVRSARHTESHISALSMGVEAHADSYFDAFANRAKRVVNGDVLVALGERVL